ncbi:transglutaminase-like cysteine peptidase [Bradyrhizobium canariense]|uniref:transglutaminase-like cysteine peptidase n=1 Tax=Bradyrhizobium canariense TaxID=255045 RepID=UPI001F0AE2A9|nr:transglutaminase-like cysteine peptidase [Bradyrhizobium canariense]
MFPSAGNCGDYAVTKRHLLLRLGWPSSSLLLGEVTIRTTGEHHLVLLVLDNLSGIIIQLSESLDNYVFLRGSEPSAVDPWTHEILAASFRCEFTMRPGR